MTNRYKYYEQIKKEVLPPSVLFRTLKNNGDDELKKALEKCVIRIIPNHLINDVKSDEEEYKRAQIEGFEKEHRFIIELKKKCSTGLVSKYYNSLVKKINNFETSNEDPLNQVKINQLKELI